MRLKVTKNWKYVNFSDRWHQRGKKNFNEHLTFRGQPKATTLIVVKYYKTF